MSSEIVEGSVAELPLWQRYADQFPVRRNLTYLNHAAVAPLPRPCADAMKHLADDCLHFGSLHYDQWLAVYDGLRVAAARLIHADPAEIALVKNTSEGIATVAMGLDWKPGDRIVGFLEEFPANLTPGSAWKQRGSKLPGSPSTIPWRRSTRPAAAPACSPSASCNSSAATAHPFKKLVRFAVRNHCIYFVDAIQGLGAFPLDVRACHIDALAADGHKWMLGPEGCAIFYINQALQDRVEPVEFGWTNVAGYNDYASRDMALRPDAGRYECGTLNTIGCFGLKASIEFLLEVGQGEIAPVVQNLGDRIAAGVQAKGYELLIQRTPQNGAGIVSFRKPGIDAPETVRLLRRQNIVTAARAGWVRTSPHFYISPADIDRLIDVLP